MLNNKELVKDMSAMRIKMKDLGVTKESIASVAKVPAAVTQLAELFKVVAGEAFKDIVSQLLEKSKNKDASSSSNPYFPGPFYPYAPNQPVVPMGFSAFSAQSSCPTTMPVVQLNAQQLQLLQQFGALPQQLIPQHQQQLGPQPHQLIPQHQQQLGTQHHHQQLHTHAALPVDHSQNDGVEFVLTEDT
eukprot:gene36240-40998_t